MKLGYEKENFRHFTKELRLQNATGQKGGFETGSPDFTQDLSNISNNDRLNCKSKSGFTFRIFFNIQYSTFFTDCIHALPMISE